MSKILIKADANTVIGMGHLKRCISIAEGAREIGVECQFAICDDYSKKLLEDTTFTTIKLADRYDDYSFSTEFEQLLISEKPDILLVDSYHVNEEFFSKARRYSKVFYIDDLHEKIWDVDGIIAYALYNDKFDYAKEYPKSELILGTKYFPLSKAFGDIPKKDIEGVAKRILIVSGGSDDKYSFMSKLVNEILQYNFEETQFVLIASTIAQYDMLEKLVRDSKQFEIKQKLPSLREEMEKADMIITAGGTTLYEMAAMGLPGLSYAIADNQLDNVKAFDKEGLALYCGDIRKDFSYEMLVSRMYNLIHDYEMRNVMSLWGQELIDSNGALRIAKRLMEAI